MEEDRRARLWESLVMAAEIALEEEKGEAEAAAAANLSMLSEYCERDPERVRKREKEEREREERVRRKREEEQREREERLRRKREDEMERRAHSDRSALKKPATAIDHHHHRRRRCSCGPSSSLMNRNLGKRRTFEKGKCSTSLTTTTTKPSATAKKQKKTIPPIPQPQPQPQPQRRPDPIVIEVMLRRCIQQLGGGPPSEAEAVLVIEKDLTETDVSRGQGRLSLPLNQLKAPHFLTPQEQHALTLRTNDGTPNEISVPLLQLPANRLATVKLKRWDMRKKSGNTSSTYVLCHTWNNVVTGNLLHAGCPIQIWSFRIGSVLHLALIRFPR